MSFFSLQQIHQGLIAEAIAYTSKVIGDINLAFILNMTKKELVVKIRNVFYLRYSVERRYFTLTRFNIPRSFMSSPICCHYNPLNYILARSSSKTVSLFDTP